MREDMAHVVVERPRRGGHSARKRRTVPLEDLPKQKGMRRHWAEAGDRKYLNENLNPLRRYLERQVGRPWDKVYAEIAARLRVDSTVQQHVRDHLEDFVLLHAAQGRFRLFGRRRGWPWRQALYVDPEDRILKRTDRHPAARAAAQQARQEPVPPPERVELAPDRELRRIDGIWYELRSAPLPEPVYETVTEPGAQPSTVRRLATPPVRDALGQSVPVGPRLDTARDWEAYRLANPHHLYVARKRTLSNHDLRRHGLANLVT